MIELLGVYVLVRSMFAGFAQLGEAKGWKWKESITVTIGMIAIVIAWVCLLVVYGFYPESLPWMYIGLPEGVRWLGFAASLAVCGLLVWVFKTIGTAGAKQVVTFEGMKLAIYHLRETVKINPKFPEAHFYLASLYENQKKYKESINYYEKAAQIDPNNPEFPYRSAMVNLESKKIDQAIKSLEKTAKISPDYKDIGFNLGKLYSETGKYGRTWRLAWPT